jgi:hypothetical protein
MFDAATPERLMEAAFELSSTPGSAARKYFAEAP